MPGLKRRDALLTLIDAFKGRDDLGRTALQKAAYFVDARLHLSLGHSAYFYGPFSSVVESDVTTLVDAGLVEENERRLGFVNQEGFEGRQYQYRVTSNGEKRAGLVADAYPQEVGAIRDVAATLLASVGRLDPGELSIAAKVHYIENREGQSLSAQQLEAVAGQFGWRLSSTKTERVREILDQLGLSHS